MQMIAFTPVPPKNEITNEVDIFLKTLFVILTVFVSNLMLQHGTVDIKSKHTESMRVSFKLRTSVFQFLKVD